MKTCIQLLYFHLEHNALDHVYLTIDSRSADVSASWCLVDATVNFLPSSVEL